MKIAITADWHFDQYARMSTINPDGRTSRLQDCVDCIEWMAKKAGSAECEIMVIAGDLFHSRTEINVSVLDAMNEALEHVLEAVDQVFIVAGNHDSYLRTPGISSISILSSERITNVNARWWWKELAFVPWQDDPKVMEQEFIRAEAHGETPYLFTHVLLAGASPSESPKLLKPSALKASQYKKVFVGDVHTPLKIGKNIQYIGAPMQHSYSDAGSKRGFWILDTWKDKSTYVENTVSPRFTIVKKVDEGASAARLRKKHDIRKGVDFVRIDHDNPEQAAKQAETLGARIVENVTVDVETVAPRISMNLQDGYEEAFRKYVEYMGVDEDLVEEYVEVGIETMKGITE